MARYKVLATQLNRLTRDTMKERRSEDREVEYLGRGDIVDDFTDAEVKRYTAGSHPGIAECDEDGNLIGSPAAQARVVAFSSDPVPGAVEELDADAVASGERGTDGTPIDLTQDRQEPQADLTPEVGDTPDQRPTGGDAATPAKPRKAAAKTVTRGGVSAGNVGEADAEDAPQF